MVCGVERPLAEAARPGRCGQEEAGQPAGYGIPRIRSATTKLATTAREASAAPDRDRYPARLQIGTKEGRGRGEPQRVLEAGRRVQTTASTGLRSTRTTARHRVVSAGGTSIVSEPESLRKTHLNRGRPWSASLHTSITAASGRFYMGRISSIVFHKGLAGVSRL
jgi:hypothetical protein